MGNYMKMIVAWLFNLTLVEIIQIWKIKEFEFGVVNRTCDILSMPLNYDPQYASQSPIKTETVCKLTAKSKGT